MASCKTDRLTVSVQAKYCGSDRRWYMNIHMRSSSGLFRVHINAKSVINFRQVSVFYSAML